ncbi:MAG: hypothetical protein KKE71_01945, partial [Nanoarchaeota archaeon]|nr:hypothetical protein [Nanoarchaeota archaeon]
MHEPETLTEIDCEFALLAVIVVHETLEPLKDFIWLSDTLHTAQLVKSRFAELQSPDHPEAEIVNVFPEITLPESAPDWEAVTVSVAIATEGNKASTNKITNIFFI